MLNIHRQASDPNECLWQKRQRINSCWWFWSFVHLSFLCLHVHLSHVKQTSRQIKCCVFPITHSVILSSSSALMRRPERNEVNPSLHVLWGHSSVISPAEIWGSRDIQCDTSYVEKNINLSFCAGTFCSSIYTSYPSPPSSEFNSLGMHSISIKELVLSP